MRAFQIKNGNGLVHPSSFILHPFTVVALAVLTWACLVPAVSAYVPRPAQLIEMMLANSGTASRLQVDQRLSVFPEQGESAVYNETLSFAFPDRFHAQIISGPQQRLLVVSGEATVRVMGDALSDSQDRLDLYKDLILYRQPNALLRRLESLGVNTAVVSLGRLDDQPVFVLGAVYPNQTTAQLWLDKQTFRPLRWIIDAGLQVRYLNWKRSQGIWYPERIEILRQGRLVVSAEADRIQVDGPMAPGLFDVQAIKRRHGTAPAAAKPLKQH